MDPGSSEKAKNGSNKKKQGKSGSDCGKKAKLEKEEMESKKENNQELDNKDDLEEEKTAQEESLFDKSVTFASLGVTESLCTACSRLGYTYPSRIQSNSLPYSLAGRDIIGLAETGSGKTLAFVLPIIQELLNKPFPFFACVLAPTRELCLQIHETFEAVGSGISLRSIVLVGGLDHMTQAVAIAKKPHVIVASPGRLLYHLENTKGFTLENLKFFVMDEADKLLNSDFEKSVDKILPYIPKKRRTFLFSATMTSKVSKLQRAALRDPVKVEVSTKHQTVSTLQQSFVFVPSKHKTSYLVYLLTENAGNSIIIFVSTCLSGMNLTLMLRNLGFPAVSIHGKMTQVKRLSALNKFKAGTSSILIATDVASRGIDIPSVDIVLNFDVPSSPKDYLHRVGRTARAGRAGKAVAIVGQYEVEDFKKIESFLGKEMDQMAVAEDDALVFYERVQEAERIAATELKGLLDKTKEKSKGKALKKVKIDI